MNLPDRETAASAEGAAVRGRGMVALGRRSYIIGRSPESDAVLSHALVSRRHAKLVTDARGGLYLADLGSRHGTFVHRGGDWQRLSDDFVGADEPVRFGLHQTTPAQLLEQIRRRPGEETTTAASLKTRDSHRQAVVLVADLVGYSRMMSHDPEGTLDALKACRRDALDPAILHHRGRIFGAAGDSVCAEFRLVDDALRAAGATLLAVRDRRFGKAKKTMAFRIGVHAGEVMVEGDTLYGSAVNIAARLQALAQPGRICVSALVKDKMRKTALSFTDLGEKELRNIPYAIQVYESDPDGT